jgi:hypothetical protein
MTVSVASFKAAFPEFKKVSDEMVAAQLVYAEFEVSDSFGDSRDLAVMLHLADLLATSPAGRDARLAADETSTYGARFQRMAEANGISATRLGSGIARGLVDSDDAP